MTEKEYRSAIEAILFANGQSVTTHQLSIALEITEGEVKKQCEILMNEYAQMDRGITIIKLNKSYQMVSQKAYAEQIRKVMDLKRNIALSQAALEVLAVVAYNQPVTKNFIEQVRGVDCSGVLGSLTAKDLIEEKGRLELPGRPLLYGTTENFLRCFSISDLSELPALPTKEADVDEGSEEDDQQLSIFKEEGDTIEEETSENTEETSEEIKEEIQESETKDSSEDNLSDDSKLSEEALESIVEEIDISVEEIKDNSEEELNNNSNEEING